MRRQLQHPGAPPHHGSASWCASWQHPSLSLAPAAGTRFLRRWLQTADGSRQTSPLRQQRLATSQSASPMIAATPQDLVVAGLHPTTVCMQGVQRSAGVVGSRRRPLLPDRWRDGLYARCTTVCMHCEIKRPKMFPCR